MAPTQEAVVEYSEIAIQTAVDLLNKYVSPTLNNICFKNGVDDGYVCVLAIDMATNQSLKKIPAKEAVQMGRSLTALNPANAVIH